MPGFRISTPGLLSSTHPAPLRVNLKQVGIFSSLPLSAVTRWLSGLLTTSVPPAQNGSYKTGRVLQKERQIFSEPPR